MNRDDMPVNGFDGYLEVTVKIPVTYSEMVVWREPDGVFNPFPIGTRSDPFHRLRIESVAMDTYLDCRMVELHSGGVGPLIGVSVAQMEQAVAEKIAEPIVRYYREKKQRERIMRNTK